MNEKVYRRNIILKNRNKDVYSLRDYFAISAPDNLFSTKICWDDLKEEKIVKGNHPPQYGKWWSKEQEYKYFIKLRYKFADAMLLERENKGN